MREKRKTRTTLPPLTILSLLSQFQTLLSKLINSQYFLNKPFCFKILLSLLLIVIPSTSFVELEEAKIISTSFERVLEVMIIISPSSDPFLNFKSHLFDECGAGISK